LVRDVNRFTENVKSLAADGTPIKLIQTWNEWTEGTGIEPASLGKDGANHGTTYIDIIAKCF